MNISQQDPIIMQFNRFGAPGSFHWQGRTYRIDVIERIWRNSQGARSGLRIYKVRSRNRRFILQFDQRLKRWSLVRTPWRTRLGLAVERLAARLAA